MIALKTLVLTNFRSFETAEVQFPKNGLLLISGKNPLTGDSSGAGKSSILLGIAYALDILPPGFPATELKNWNSKEGLQVDLSLDVDGESVVVGRGKENYFLRDGKKTTGAKPVAEEIRKLFGMSSEVLQAVTYRPQGSSGLFLSKTPAQKAEFLVPLLGLDAVEIAVEAAEARAKILKSDLESGTKALENSLSVLETVKKDKPQGEQTPVDVLRDIVAGLKARADECRQGVAVLEQQERQELEELKTGRSRENWELTEKIKQAQKFLADVRAENSKKKAEFDSRQNEVRTEIRKADLRLQELAAMGKEGQRLVADLETLKGQKCPTCEQAWVKADNKIKEITTRLEFIEKARLELLPLENYRRNTEAMLAEVFVQNPLIEKFLGVEQHLKAELRGRTSLPILAEATTKLQAARQSYQEARLELQKAEQVLEVTEARNGAQEREAVQYGLRFADAETRVRECQEKVANLETTLNAEKDFVAMMGREGFLGLIFEEVLADIASEANRRLARLANVSHVTVDFRTETQTKVGGVRRNIAAVVTVGGREGRFESALSGGMQTSVEQAVDLAVMAVIQRRTGKAPGWLCLDEIFDGQGRASKESALEVLREFSTDKLILVIDHGEEFRQMFSQVIQVVCENGKSSLG